MKNISNLQRYTLIIIMVILYTIALLTSPNHQAHAEEPKISTTTPKLHTLTSGKNHGKKVVILPLDSRNQTYDYIRHIVKITGYTPVVPPREILGNINSFDSSYKNQYNVWYWLNHNLDGNVETAVISADSLIYGGLLESRNSPIRKQDALNNANLFKIIRKNNPHLNILVFTSIPRKEAEHRDRNLAVNKKLLELVEEGVIDFLSISGDDVTDIKNQVLEIARLKDSIKEKNIGDKVFISDVDRIRLGIDESAMVIFMRNLNKSKDHACRIYVEYRDINAARMVVDHYSATPVMSLTLDMIEAIGGEITYDPDQADFILAVNHPSKIYSMDHFLDRLEALSKKKPITIGDLSNRDEKAEFFHKLYKRGLFPTLAGYATWGMGTNTLGTSLTMACAVLASPDLESYTEFIAFLYERMLADYIYLNNIHLKLARETGVPAYSLTRMKPEQEHQITGLTTGKIIENLKELGITAAAYRTTPTSDTPDEINYIPINPEDRDTPPNNIIIKFNITIPKERLVGTINKHPAPPLTASITAGPISFPFHRLFEITIPVKANLK